MKKLSVKTNKEKKNNKMNNNIPMSNIFTTDEPFLTPPRIDGISIVVDMPDRQLLGQMNHEILCGIKYSGYVEIKKPKMYAIAAIIPCPDLDGVFDVNNPFVTIMTTHKDHLTPQVRIRFNPEKLFSALNNVHPARDKESVIEHLNSEFIGMCGLDFFQFLAHGRITSLDIFRDICHRSPGDYMFRVKYAQTCLSFCGSSGLIETLCFGKRSSNQVRIYNKAKELFGKKAPFDRLRIEYSMKPTNTMMFNDLWALENPFKRISLFSLKCDAPPYGEGHWIAFTDSCRLWGITKAISRQPKNMQHQLRKVLKDHPAPWWEMNDDDWFFHWHGALEECCLNLTPDNPPLLSWIEGVGEAA